MITIIIIIKTLYQEVSRSTRASNERKKVKLTDKRMYMYTYNFTIEPIKHKPITVS